jgi:hypothetical protein
VQCGDGCCDSGYVCSTNKVCCPTGFPVYCPQQDFCATDSSGCVDQSGGGDTDPNNVCFLPGDSQAQANQACAKVAAKTGKGGGTFYFCDDPGSGLGNPQLPNGNDPKSACTTISNAEVDVVVKSGFAGCDHDLLNDTCYCCP